MQNSDLTVNDVINDDSRDLLNIYNIFENENEPNSHLYSTAYYTETEIRDLHTQGNISDDTHLKIFSLNVANILTKISSLKNMIHNISNNSNKPNIITITETHLNDSCSQGYSKTELRDLLPGYKFFFKNRKNKRGGGVGIFIADELAGTAEVTMENCFFEEEVFESMQICIPSFPLKPNKKNLIVLTVYRQPGQENLNRFFEILETWLSKYDRNNNEIIITGDFNLDLLKYHIHNRTSQYLDLMSSHGLLPAITKPTRIKHQSATLIDHIFTKLTEPKSSIVLTELAGTHGYTDHYPVFIQIELNKTYKCKRKITTQFFTREGHRKRREALRNENWDELYNENDPNIVYDAFHKRYLSHYQAALTTKTKFVNERRIPKQPWMSQDILKKIRRRDRLAKNPNRREDYKRLRNQIVKDCRKAEKNYINNEIQKNINNIKEHWNILNRVMGKTNNKLDLPSAFYHDNTWITNTKQNATHMNTYYANVGPDTNKSVGNSKESSDFFLNKFCTRNSEKLPEYKFSEDDIRNACNQIRKKRSCDLHGFSQAVVLSDIDILSPIMTHIANCSLEKGVCPELTKTARVIPVYKGKSENFLYSNYRPISLIPVFSKILEKLIYSKIFDFLVRYKILFKSQYGFRTGHSTVHATLDFLQVIENALQDQEYAIGIFCDLSKAFDTLDHRILLKKLDHYGIRDNWNMWLKSYLTNRKQYVDINGVCSETKNISVGVPQGSILGPLLFLIYINDLPGSLEKLSAILFADDTNLIIKGKNLHQLIEEINSDLEVLNDYFQANKLKLNASKTKLVCFRKKNQQLNKDEILIKFDGTLLVPEENATFLGVILDEYLNWGDHCNKVANTMARNFGVLNRVKKSIPSSSMKILFNSLIFPHYSYCLEAWGSCQSKYLKRIQILQKKAVRAISSANWLSHTEPRMKKLGILKVEDQHNFQCVNQIFHMLKGYSPDIFNMNQQLNANRSEHSLRSSSNQPTNLRLAASGTQRSQSFSNIAPALWNEIPLNIQNVTSKNIFKKHLKNHFLHTYADKVSCANIRCVDQRFHT